MQNPFTFGAIVSGEDFVDRQREISEFTQALLSRTNAIIASPRRYGKTALVLEVFRRITKQGALTIYVDLFPATSRIRFIEIYAEAVSRASRDKLEEAIAFRELPRPEGRGLPAAKLKDIRAHDLDEIARWLKCGDPRGKEESRPNNAGA